MKKTSALLAVIALSTAAPVWAIPVTLGYASSASNLVAFGNDTIQLAGQSGSLNADTSVATSSAINLASFIVDYTSPSPAAPLAINLTFDFTLDGITHSLTQSGLFTITDTLDTVLASVSSAPTSFGAWNVSLQGWQVSASAPGRFTTSVIANVAYVPEPTTLALLGLGLAGFGLSRRKKA